MKSMYWNTRVTDSIIKSDQKDTGASIVCSQTLRLQFCIIASLIAAVHGKVRSLSES